MRIGGLSVFVQIDPDQYDTLNRKLDRILQALEDKGKLSSVTAGLKKSGDALTEAVAENQPQP